MQSYCEMYLADAMLNLGEAVDYAVHTCGLDADEFLGFFINCGLADMFGGGNPKYVSGLSGTELAREVLDRCGYEIRCEQALVEFDCSQEYWSGWILAYYQWASGRNFRDILSVISMKEVLSLYSTLHEAPEDKFVDAVDARFMHRTSPSRLQEQRKRCGYSQRELADRSGVNLRTLQQYELATKDIAKASFSSVMAMAKVLGCRSEDIIG